MGRRGPPPTPTKILNLRDSLRGKYGRKNEIEPETGTPERPADMRPEAVAEWERVVPILENLGILCPQDRAALVLMCEAWADYQDAKAECLERGVLIQEHRKDGMKWVRNPAIGARTDAYSRWKGLALEFGLTPSARSRIQNPGKKPEGKKSRFFGAG